MVRNILMVLEYGYGGYQYDGRWINVAKDITSILILAKVKVLGGCEKGFLVKDLVDLGIDASGVDISDYAIENSMVDIKNDYYYQVRIIFLFKICLLMPL